MASDTEASPKSETSQDNQSYVTAASQQEDTGQTGSDLIVTNKLLDIYDLEAVSSLLETDSVSFFAAYARGDWDPTSIPPVPQELAPLLGEPKTATGLQLIVEKRESPPTVEKSVEEAYLTYLVDAKTPGTSDLHGSLDQIMRLATSDTSFPNGSLDAGPANLTANSGELTSDVSMSAKATNNIIEELSSPSDSASSGLFCGTPPLSNFSQAAANRFAAAGYLEAPLPKDEKYRRMAVRRYFPFGEHIDYNLDRIIRLGKMMFSVNNAAISMVDTNYVHVSIPNADPVIVPRGDSMCSHTILIKKIDEPLVILDTLEDWRFRNNPTVTGAWAMRFYAGYPLRTKDGMNVGTICLIDDKPRHRFTDHERAELKELAQMVLRELESRQHERQAATRDHMQSSIEVFNRDLVSESRSANQVAPRLVDTIASTLKLEGVLILEAQKDADIKRISSNPSNQPGMQTTPNRAPELVLDDHDNVTILAASRHATANFKPSGFDYADLMTLLKESPPGVSYNADKVLPHSLRALLPTGVTAAAAVLIFRGVGRPFAVICAYTTQPNFAFEIPDSLLTYLRAMGSILCTIQEKQVLSLADKAKVDFIANISHELRTPLHGVLASCDLLNETSLSAAQESLLDTAQACASSLAETINHVLDFTKANSRPSKSTREAVDLAWLIESTMNGGWLGRAARTSSDGSAIGELYAPEKQPDTSSKSDQLVEPLIEIQPMDNWTVMMDKAGLRRILLNLIGNSMKFTTEGYVKVGLYQVGTDEGGRRTIEIVVEDTGLGMSSDFVREKLFHPFSQADPLAHGIGLGLAIVRSILKSFGIDGTIDVKSKLGVGTRMTVRLVAEVFGSQKSEWYRTPQVPKGSSLPPTAWCGFRAKHRGSVLLRTSLRELLAQWNCRASEVGSSKAKLLVVDSDGMDIADLPNLATSNPKILLLCSVPVHPNVFKVAQEYTEHGGLCLTVMKPAGPHSLARALTKIMDDNAPTPPFLTALNPPELALEAVSGKIETSIVKDSAATTRPMPHIETYSQLRVLIVEDNSVNRKVLSAFLRKRQCEFVEACDGVEGVQAFQKYPDGYFHVILMDLQMPLKNGFQAAKEIREVESDRLLARTASSDAFRPVYIYALTGLASSDDRDRATEIGFNGYLVKPLAFKVLDITLKSVLETLSR